MPDPALGTAGDECRDEKWLLSEMRKGIQLVLEEQTQRKFEDDSLVARVEKLEHAVRDLNDGEDEKMLLPSMSWQSYWI